MGDAVVPLANKPLDIRLLDEVDVEEETPQIEIVAEDGECVELPLKDRKFWKLSSQDLEEKIKRMKNVLKNESIKMPDQNLKLQNSLRECEQEQKIRIHENKRKLEKGSRDGERERNSRVTLVRNKPPETRSAPKYHCSASEDPDRRVIRTRTTSIHALSDRFKNSKTDGSKNANRNGVGNGALYREEINLLQAPKEEGPSLQRLAIADDSIFDIVKDKARPHSGDQAGTSSRHGLRSSSSQSKAACLRCSRMVSPSNILSIGNGGGLELYCPSCIQMKFGDSNLLADKHPQADDSAESSDDESTKRRRSMKRRRQSPSAEERAGSVVELVSSDDEKKDEVSRPPHVERQNGYGLRSTATRRMEDMTVAYPSTDDPEAIEVAYADLDRLKPLEFLNDTIIDFYIKYMQRPEFLDAEQKTRFHFFNSFFYKKLSEIVNPQGKKQGHNLTKLRKWTKGTNIFEKEYLFVPIHDKWHWSLAIICHPGASGGDSQSERCILHLDSMNPGHKSGIVFKLLKAYLVAEWSHQSSADDQGDSFQSISADDFLTKKVQVPQQDNESDCGLFLLHYIECFLKDAPEHFKLSDLDYDYLFGRTWFEPSRASALRGRILKLLEKLFRNSGVQENRNKGPIEVMPDNLEPK